MMYISRHWSTYRALAQRHLASTLVACSIGLSTLLGSSAAGAQFLPLDPTQVVINAAGGQTAQDGLQVYLGNLGGIQVVGNGIRHYYGDLPIGQQGVNNGFFMAVGPAGAATVYGPQLNIQWAAIPWTAVSQSEVTGDGTAEAPYQVITIVSAAGFHLGQTVRYIVPKGYFDIRLTLVPPAGNADDVRIYHWLDTYLNGGDYGPAFWQPNVGAPTVVGVAKGDQYELFIQGSRAWDRYFSGRYYIAGDLMELGGSLDNTLNVAADTDNGIAAQWDVGAPTGPVTWTYRLATVQVTSSTCGDGDVTGFEGCDDEDTDDNDGCSSICQVEVGYACIGAPSACEECFEDIDCDDGDDCTTDTCSDNACGRTTVPPGAECLTGVCDAGGSCVECLEDEDCGSIGPFCNTQTNTCYCAVDTDCDDENECTSGECASGRCAYSELPPEAECSTGHCNGDADAPLCICETDDDCDDQNTCSVEVCVTNECLYVYAAADDVCDTGFCSEDDVPVCLQCFEDEHCPSDEPWCKTTIDECVECLNDGHCDDDNACTLDGCENDVCTHDLLVGDACDAGGFCSDEEPACVECVTSAHCPSQQPRCSNHECVRCAINAHCNDGNDCTTDTCNALGSCRHSVVEPGTACAGGYCAGTSSPACVTCADSEDGALDDGCSAALPVCLTVGNGSSCVLCEANDAASGDFGCEGETPFCNAEASPLTCIQCRTTDDCVDGETCSTAGDCVERCEVDDDCLDAAASRCVAQTGECVECLSDDDCQGDDTCSGASRCLGTDTDGDGAPDDADLDDDDDGIADVNEAAEDVDLDGDGLPNSLDRDSDGDGIADVVEAGGEDSDGDGVWDDSVDANGNGIADAREGDIAIVDSDADGTPDFLDTDSDDDGIADSVEASDANYDGAADQPASGNDGDNDGLDAAFDSSEGGTAAGLPDQDNNGLPDYQDARVVIPHDSGVPGTTDEVDASAPPEPTEEPTTEEPTDTSEETEQPTTEEPTESDAATGETEDTEPTTAQPTSAQDAGTAAQTTTDPIVDAGADAGTGGDTSDDGCDCRVAGARSTPGTPSALWLLAVAGLLLKRRSRSS